LDEYFAQKRLFAVAVFCLDSKNGRTLNPKNTENKIVWTSHATTPAPAAIGQLPVPANNHLV
jgi:hypothetical protein